MKQKKLTTMSYISVFIASILAMVLYLLYLNSPQKFNAITVFTIYWLMLTFLYCVSSYRGCIDGLKSTSLDTIDSKKEISFIVSKSFFFCTLFLLLVYISLYYRFTIAIPSVGMPFAFLWDRFYCKSKSNIIEKIEKNSMIFTSTQETG